MDELFPGELSSAVAGGIAAAEHRYTGAGASPMDAALNVRFYAAAHLNQEMTARGYHWVNEDNEPVACPKGQQLDTTRLKRVLCTCISESTGDYSELVKRQNIKDGFHIVPKAPVFEDKVMITIRIAGQTDYIDTFAWIDESPTPNPGAHNIRFKKQYDYFLSKGQGTLLVGSPIENLAKTTPPVLKLSQVEDLKYRNIRTVQALIAMPAPESSGIMGIHAIIAGAKEYLKSEEAAFPAQQMEAEHKKLELLVKGQAAQIQDLMSKLKELGGDKPKAKRGPGRPKKTEPEAPAEA